MIPNTEDVRRERAAHARSRLADVRTAHDGRPLVLSSVGAVAWATGGLSIPIDRAAAVDPVWLVVRDEAATLVVNSVEVARLRAEYDLDDLGVDVVSAAWQEERGHADAVERIVGAPLGACLTDGPEGVDVTSEIVAARLALSAADLEVLNSLALEATAAVEGAARDWRPGVTTDREVAARVASSLEAVGADAVCLIVGGDDRVRSFRHPLAAGVPVHDLLMVVVVARYQGLHAALTRLATTHADRALDDGLAACEIVHQRVLAATRAGATWGDAYTALGEGYREVGAPEAWRDHYQGGPIGYAQREFELAPASSASPWWGRPIEARTAVAWNPSLAGGAKIEDTYVVDDEGPRCLTDSGDWPRRDGPGSGAAAWVK